MITRTAFSAAVCLCLTALPAPVGAACGTDPGACALDGREYHAAVPASPHAPIVVFLHGVGSSGGNVMRNTVLVDDILARGYAVLAPTGQRRFGPGAGRAWSFRPAEKRVAEADFLHRVVADSARRFDLNAGRVLLAGFSNGAFLVNYLACTAPDSFAAYAAVSGGFWRPLPENCAGPVRLFHTHGWADPTVPIEGRFLARGRFQQGDIFAGLELWRQTNLCPHDKPSGFSRTGPFWRRNWRDCAPGAALELALFPGGHQVPAGWADMVLDWFETVTVN
ncbi:alpha/beta hydrolase family esterase [Sedimentitalea sp. HM32M-2]|uniref:alpha/beta hydrolase family esterase n=1 Tax=Sedimentitalea sp. HM32M-2 TaxID=3351566 RepID=UPI00362776BC